ncbi:hypothetical protein [Streptomyces griseoruber]|uniref:Uncharacterized protein n=1 Tax=Streptomyces griseoruber TaxID=1943 RepID=A0A101SU18_9ACTN|nr:hypothetical protein [Streptomyces griseoruber]KUN80200.1 hypothetical protein AQJ64_25900 [Streptomyces griseoruber]
MTTAWSTVRAWCAVHATRQAALLLGATALLSLLGARSALSGLGVFFFETPVPLLLLVPTLSGVAVGIGCHRMARVPLPEPPRVLAARFFWCLGLTAVGAVSVTVAQLAGSPVEAGASLRNVLLHAGLAVLTTLFLGPAVAWLPSMALTLVAMLYGHSQSGPEVYWWAGLLEDQVTEGQWWVVGALFVGSATTYAIAAPVRDRRLRIR